LVCALVALVSTACGSRLPDEVLKAIDARNTSGTQAVAAGSLDGADGSQTATSGSGAQASGTLPGSSGGGSTGTTAGGTSAVNAASKCNQAKSDAPGVTDDEIKVASIVTDSGPLPGATEGSFRGAASYFAMVNAAGGVCGRKITLLKGDDGLDAAKGRGEFLRLEPDVFAFTGSFSVADSGYIDLIESTGVPWVAIVVDPAGRGPHNVMPRTLDGIVNTGPFVWWKKQHPNVKRAAVLYADVGGVSANVPGFEKAIEKAGFDRRYTAAAGVATPDYTPEVQQAQDEGIEFFYLFAFEVNMHVRMIRNMRQQNYDPPIKGANIAFNTRFSQLNGKDGDGWENHQTHLLFLDPAERARSADLAKFIDWNERVFPGAQLDLFPVSGWGRAAIFVEAMQKIEGAITREALIDALYKVKTFNGGGVETTVDPSTGLGEPCWNMAVHRGGHWVREFPTNKLYECNTGELLKFK
jgi:ABC-type branched-subunit amino acid transport system substrate-binding protein